MNTHRAYSRRIQSCYIVAIILLGLLLAAINLPVGIGEDSDAYYVLRRALQFRANGYQRSRTWGFPLYELATYPITFYLGTLYGKLYSMVCQLLASVVLFFTLRSQFDLTKALLGTLCFLGLPVSIISSNSLMETSQGILFAVVALFFYVRFHHTRRSVHLYLMALFLGAATASRPEYVILSSALAFTVLRFDKVGLGHVVFGLLIWVAFCLGPFLIYGRFFFGTSVILPDPFLRKLARALLGYVTLLGIPASALVGLWILRNYRDWLLLARQTFTDRYLFLFAVSLVLYSIRFVLLPDEPEYVYVLVPLFIMVVSRLGTSNRGLAMLAVAIALPNLFQMHLFTRGIHGGLMPTLGISPGAIIQDRRGRMRNEFMYNELPEVMQVVARDHGFEEYTPEVSTKPGTLVIIPEDQLRYYGPDRMGGKYSRAFDR